MIRRCLFLTLTKINDAHARRHLTRDLLQSFARRAAGIKRDDRLAIVAAVTDARVNRHAAQERHAQARRHPRAAAAAKDVGWVAAVGANEGSHVLDDAKDGHL